MTRIDSVIFFNSTMNLGGVPKVISLWSNYFISKNLKVEIVKHTRKDSYFQLNKKIKITNLKLENDYFKNRIKNFKKIKKFLNNRENSLIIFNKAFYIKYLFWIKFFRLDEKNNKLLYFSHSGTKDFETFYSNFQNLLIYKTFDKILVNHDDFILKENFKAKKTKKNTLIDFFIPFRWNIFKKKVVVCINPIKKEKKIILNKNNYILCSGRLSEEKQFNIPIRVLKEINKINKKIKLIIAGKGPEEKKLKSLARKLKIENSIKFLNSNDLKRIFSKSFLYMFTSIHNARWREGMPTSVLDALNFGLPVISTNNANGTKFLVKHNVNGFICDKKKIEQIAKIVLSLYNNTKDLNRMSLASKKISIRHELENSSHIWKKKLALNL